MTMTEECGSFVGGTQDGTYASGNNRNDPGDNQLTGLEQHKDGYPHMHTAVLLLTGQNPYFLPAQTFQ